MKNWRANLVGWIFLGVILASTLSRLWTDWENAQAPTNVNPAWRGTYVSIPAWENETGRGKTTLTVTATQIRLSFILDEELVQLEPMDVKRAKPRSDYIIINSGDIESRFESGLCVIREISPGIFAVTYQAPQSSHPVEEDVPMTKLVYPERGLVNQWH